MRNTGLTEPAWNTATTTKSSERTFRILLEISTDYEKTIPPGSLELAVHSLIDGQIVRFAEEGKGVVVVRRVEVV